MINNILHIFASQSESIRLALLLVNALIHIIFAGAVAKDAGILHKRGCQTIMVSGVTWSFSTLVGGVFVATIYWFLLHSKLTR